MQRRLQAFIVLVAMLAVSVLVPPAFAGGGSGLNLSWDDCGTAGVQDKARASCDQSNTGQQDFYASFIPPSGITLNSAAFFFGIVSSTPAMPLWWQIGAAPNCRPANGLGVNYITPCGSGTDYWGTIPGGPFGGFAYEVNPAQSPNQVPGANHAIIRGVVAVDNQAAQLISSTTEYYAATVTLRNVASTTCAGCDVPVCILFTAAQLFDPDTIIDGSPPGGRNFITWQGGAGANCAEVPARNKTWGEVKALYR